MLLNNLINLKRPIFKIIKIKSLTVSSLINQLKDPIPVSYCVALWNDVDAKHREKKRG